VASEAGGGMTTPPRRAAQRAGLAVLALAALALMAPSGPGARPRAASRGGAAKTVRTIVVVKDLDAGRQYSSIVDRQRPALDRLDGTLRSGETEARVAAFLEAGELRLIDERARYGENGGTARNRYYVHEGRLVFFDSVRVRPRDVGKDRLPARDEVVIELAFGDDGRIVGKEKTVNHQPVELPPADESGIRSRFASLASAVAAAGKPAPPP
jgi:hypothetical protein